MFDAAANCTDLIDILSGPVTKRLSSTAIIDQYTMRSKVIQPGKRLKVYVVLYMAPNVLSKSKKINAPRDP